MKKNLPKTVEEPRDAVCSLCGMDVTKTMADEIDATMEYDNKSCAGCGRTFSEARREEGLL